MAPKERVIAKIPAKGSSPAVEVLAKRESDMPSFGTVRPPHSERLIAVAPARKSPKEDSLSWGIYSSGIHIKAATLFQVLRIMLHDAEPRAAADGLSFHAGSRGIFMGDRKIGQASGLSGDSPQLKVWMDWLYKHPGSRASNFEIMRALPLPVMVNLFSVGDIASFANELASSRYMAVSTDKFMVCLQLYGSKSAPELHSFRIKWDGFR